VTTTSRDPTSPAGREEHQAMPTFISGLIASLPKLSAATDASVFTNYSDADLSFGRNAYCVGDVGGRFSMHLSSPADYLNKNSNA